MIRLCCTDHVLPHPDMELPLDSLPVVIGRGETADVQIIDQFASRMHCELSLRNSELQVRDLDSGNGTRLNGEEIECSPIQPGDLLSIGVSTFRVRFSPRGIEAESGQILDSEVASAEA